jgi:hypothetical protein
LRSLGFFKIRIGFFWALAALASACSPQIKGVAINFGTSTHAVNLSADQLQFAVQPSSSAMNTNISPAISVIFVNELGAIDREATGTVSIAIGNNPSSGVLGGTLSAPPVLGVATFPGLNINQAGNGYTLIASSGLATNATSSGFNITAPGATQLAFTTGPSNAQAGSSLGSIVVTIEDSLGQVVIGSSAAVTLAIANNAGPGGVLSGTTTVNAVNGVATFPGLSINIAGTGYTLQATSTSLTSATSTAFNIIAGSATHLAFTTEPVNAASGTSLGSIAVTVEDADGNKVSSSSASITLAIVNNAGPGGVLSGTTTVNAVNGVATFPGLSINLDGTGYTLGASASSLTSATSTAFNITSSGATQLVFSTEPASAVSGSSLGSIAVTVEDADGNKVSSSSASITLAIANNAGPGGVLSGTTTVSAVNGVATFPGLSINLVGTGYTLQATATSLTSATSSAFNITAGSASQLVFTTEPASAQAGSSLGSIAVTVEDAAGNKITSSNASITLAIANNAGPGGVLSGTLTISAVSGVATFPGLNINLAGTGYTLQATATSLTSATSNAFNISAGAASQLAFTTEPSSAQAGASLGGIAVTVEDADGNKVASSSASITLAIANNAGPGGALSGTVTVNASSGVATFPGLSINIAGSGYTLSAAATSLSGATSSAFNISAGTASKLVFSTQPSSALLNGSLGNTAVSVEDFFGNLVSSSSASITLAIANNPGAGSLSGTLTVNASSGVATFPGLSINAIANGYTLAASSSSLTGATSTAFNIVLSYFDQFAYSNVVTTSASAKTTTVDSLGNVYSAGTSVFGNWTVREFSSGTWSVIDNFTYVWSISGYSTINALGADSLGNVYAVGVAEDTSYNPHWLVRKYSGGVWTTIDDYIYPSGYQNAALAIATDSLGDIYVLGTATTTVGHWLVRKYSGGIWSTIDDYTGADDGGYGATGAGIAVDSATGKVYAVGSDQDATFVSHWVARELQSGSWSTIDDFQYTSGYQASSTGVAVDSSGNVYAVGSGNDGTNNHWIARKFQSGSWSTTDDFLYASNVAFANAVTLDSSGNVYVAGMVQDPTYSWHHWLVREYSGGSWNTIDDYTYPGNTAGAIAFALASDSSGNVYVAGSGSYWHQTGSSGATGYVRWVERKYSGGSWSTIDDYVDEISNSGASALAINGAGNIFVAGSGQDSSNYSHWLVREYNSGSWSTTDDYLGSTGYGAQATAVSLDSAGNIFVTGYGQTNTGGQDWVTRMYSTGSWSTIDDYAYPGQINSTAPVNTTDPSGNVYVAGGADIYTSSQVWHWVVREYSGGSWNTIDDYTGPGGNGAGANAISSDSSGNIYVAGFYFDSSYNGHWTVRKYSSGSWSTIDDYTYPSGNYSSASGMTIDSSGNLYVVGEGYDSSFKSHWIVRELSGASWSTLDDYTGIVGGDGASATMVAVESSGNIYVGGNYFDSSYDAHPIVREYNSSTGVWSVVQTTALPAGLSGGSTAILVLPGTGQVLGVGSAQDTTSDTFWITQTIVP